MLTNNGKAMLKINDTTSRSGSMYMKDTSGSTVTVSNGQNSAVSQIFQRAELVVGTGSNTPDAGDYSVTNMDAGLTMVTKSGTNDSESPSYEQGYIAIFSKTYRNDTADNVTISEVAIKTLAMDIYQSPQFVLIIARDVIDPVTIAPGEAYTFTMYIG